MDVQYFTVDGFAGRLFRCDAYRATITVDACSRRWNAAQHATGNDVLPVEHCRSCPIGAAHAGKPIMVRHANYDSPICPRCGHGGSRLIANRRCVSCYNREREFVTGKNAKGTRPTIPLQQRELGVIVNAGAAGECYVGIRELTLHDGEILRQLARVAVGRFTVVPVRGGAARLTLAELAEAQGWRRPRQRRKAPRRAPWAAPPATKRPPRAVAAPKNPQRKAPPPIAA